MPRTPTIIADSTIRTGPTSPYASPDAFGAAEGSGMAALGQGLGNVASATENIAAKMKLDDENRFVNSSAYQFHMEASEYAADEKNNSQENFAGNLRAHLEKRRNEFLKQSPSGRASNRLRAALDSNIESRYSAALAKSVQTKFLNFHRELDKNIFDAMTAFRADAATSPEYASTNLEPMRQLMMQTIEARYGELAPDTAEKLREMVSTQLIIGTASHAPGYARQLLNEASDISEDQRTKLENHIENAENTGMRIIRAQVMEDIEDRLAAAEADRKPVKRFAPGALQAIFGKEAGTILEMDFYRRAERKDNALETVNRFRDKNASYVQAELSKLNPESRTQPERAALQDAMRILNDDAERQYDDPALWLQQNNVVIREAFTQAQGLPGAEQQQEAFERAAKMLLHYQGAPPSPLAPDEAAKYLDRPKRDQHLYTKKTATEQAAMIRKGTPSQQLAALHALQASYHDKDLWHIAYSDLVNLPPKGQGIPQELQIAFLIEDPITQQDFVAAISNTEALGKLSQRDQDDFKLKLETNPTWNQFMRSMIGDNWQRAGDMADYKSGIEGYAKSIAMKERIEPGMAVEKAVDRILERHLGFAEVNGMTLAIPKSRDSNDPPRTDEEVHDYGRRLSLALKHIDTKQVRRDVPIERMIRNRLYQQKLNLFPTLPSMLGEGSLEVEQHLRDIITTAGFFMPEADGQSFTLYVMGDDHNAFQLRDKFNQPFELYLDDLPTFTTQGPAGTVFAGGMGMTPWTGPYESSGIIKEQPDKIYNIVERERPPLMMTGTALPSPLLYNTTVKPPTLRTNWPVTAEYFFRQQKADPKHRPHQMNIVP
jgi:hypothetical protein